MKIQLEERLIKLKKIVGNGHDEIKELEILGVPRIF